MGRWIAVRAAALGLRHGISELEIFDAIMHAFPHRDDVFANEVLAAALRRAGRAA